MLKELPGFLPRCPTVPEKSGDGNESEFREINQGVDPVPQRGGSREGAAY
ncbi:MAG: hypothetical protein GDA43_12300 [Hormoscilla sp. SP5CHS1]|nr:hypothetical protein [Hormoscilla sp. SP12CHS1]MBC6453882.1 hypothetical protein [Hormoscilla sp. SP5CHS1]MBC6473216.1 hypothetical protein [Hormoscilla sp. GM102CHS1]